MAVPIQIYNTLTRRKEEFIPLRSQSLSFYSCGPTVYHFAHIGNLRTYIFNDLVKRSFMYAGYAVHHVMNITDVGHLTSDADVGDDKMEKGALREKKTVWQIAQEYTEAFKNDLRRLQILEPHVWCKATDYIDEQIAQIQDIEKNGYAYVIDDGVYFDTAKMSDYGKLAGLDISGLQAGARVEMVVGKRHACDFALWKFSPKDSQRQMEWDSPWGRGFPGWHIECSAMSVRFLGDEFDLHTGGIDHIPVHHTNEIAQAQACHKPFARYWMHGEFLVLKDSEKMSKSGDNFLTLTALIDKGFSPLHFRYLCLGAHYSKQLAFDWDILTTAKNSYQSLCNKILHYREATDVQNGDRVQKYKHDFLEALCDDINVPQALAVLWNVLSDNQLGGKDKYDLALHFDVVLGLNLGQVGDVVVPDDVMKLVQKRAEARRLKDWAQCDLIREQIQSLGFDVRDTAQGPVVQRKTE